MDDINFLAVGAATIVAFVSASVFYSVFAAQLQAVSSAANPTERPPAWKMLVEIARCVVLTTIFAGIAAEIGVDGIGGAVLLALVLFIGFPAMLWTGAMLWENTPWRLAALHGGDWLLKLLLIAVVIGLWR
ncbi:DUF1761 domain-containing protein [Antrihabitans stalactiti]|uniref:DUF1761 domain-containing protein n=1 Tax=Antrihabitans stalactiti TaxID=2584121 RepID=A0A848KEH1_9NOCA|nr:DUF1761 domain-containing protein [Antrihabitans stalactiti]NMN97333.1 DUF1761 domain-containing protein [Antrihabitans stalactiti]